MNSTNRRFNCIDLFLLLLCLAAVLSLILQGNLARKLGLEDPGRETKYTLLLRGLSPEDVALFAEEQKLFHPKTGEELGTVLSALPETAAENPALRNLTLTVSGRGTQGARGFLLIGSIHASPGDTLSVTPGSKTDSQFEAVVLPNAKNA